MTEKISVYSLVTPSHQALLERWYLRTLPGDCIPTLHHVAAKPVDFGTANWHRVVLHKFDLLERAFSAEPDKSIFVLSDVDIRFYRPFTMDVRRRMSDLDVLFQNNRPFDPHPFRYLCTGFVVIRNCAATQDFFIAARKVLETMNDPLVGDQAACVRAIASDPARIRFGLLPVEYWVPKRNGSRWVPGVPLDPPSDLVLHHANYTVGVANKLAQLAAVEQLLLAAELDLQ